MSPSRREAPTESRLSGWISVLGSRRPGRGGAWEDAAEGGRAAGQPALLGPRSLRALGPSKLKCVRTAERAAAVVPGLARARPAAAASGKRAVDGRTAGSRGAGPARASAPSAHLGARAGPPHERAAGPSVRAVGADWPAGRRGRDGGAGLGPPSRGPRRRRFHEDLDSLSSGRGGRAATSWAAGGLRRARLVIEFVF